MSPSTPNRTRRTAMSLALPILALLSGCVGRSVTTSQELTTRGAIECYRAAQGEQLKPFASALPFFPSREWDRAPRNTQPASFTFGSYPSQDEQAASSQPASGESAGDGFAFTPPEGYWKDNLMRQAGGEFTLLAKRDFWRGYKTAFWDVENALLLAGTMGISVAIRESGVDDTVRGRVRGHRQFGDMDETIQILGNPATHFAGAGVLWLTSALTEDFKQHEVAKKLTQALAVNGATTLLLKASANTRGPDGDRFAWPSGHTSSAFTVAAVVNEYYGPLVGIPSLALAGLVGYQRIDSRTHDLSDVIFGGMLGYIIGSSIARDGKAEFPEIFGMKLVPYSDPRTGAAGLALVKQF